MKMRAGSTLNFSFLSNHADDKAGNATFGVPCIWYADL